MLYVDCPNQKTSLMVTLFLETPILSVEPFGSELNSMQNHEFCGHWGNSKQNLDFEALSSIQFL